MNKIKVRIISILFIVLFAIQISYIVLTTEREKKIRKAMNERDYYQTLYNDYINYRMDYFNKVSKTKNDNAAAMAQAEQQYKDLLSKQQDLIKQNTKLEISRVPSTDKVTVEVTKPASKPKTKTS